MSEHDLNIARARRAHDNRTVTILRTRRRLQLLLEAAGIPWKREVRRHANLSRGSDNLVFDCGCVLPYGYPLYRRFSPCARHQKVFGL